MPILTMDDKKTPPEGTPPNDQEGNGGAKSYTPEELQAEIDRVAIKTRAEEKTKADKERQKAVAEAVAEANALAKLSAEEQAKAIEAKRSEELTQKERDIALRENRVTAKEKLTELKISTELVDLVVDQDPAVQDKKILALQSTFEKAVTAGVALKLQGDPPKDFGKNQPPEKKKAPTSF